MELVEHIVAAVAVLIAGISSWFTFRGFKLQKGQRKEDVVRKAIATARAHPAQGIPIEATAFEYAVLIDKSDGKSDFKRDELWAEVRAQLASEKK